LSIVAAKDEPVLSKMRETGKWGATFQQGGPKGKAVQVSFHRPDAGSMVRHARVRCFHDSSRWRLALLSVPIEPAPGRGNSAGAGIAVSYEICRWASSSVLIVLAACISMNSSSAIAGMKH
jgi:hypothetical protein